MEKWKVVKQQNRHTRWDRASYSHCWLLTCSGSKSCQYESWWSVCLFSLPRHQFLDEQWCTVHLARCGMQILALGDKSVCSWKPVICMPILTTYTSISWWRMVYSSSSKMWYANTGLGQKECLQLIQCGVCHEPETSTLYNANPPCRLSTGTYILQASKARFNKYSVDQTCPLWGENHENCRHFLLECTAFNYSHIKYINAYQTFITENFDERPVEGNFYKQWHKNLNILCRFVQKTSKLPAKPKFSQINCNYAINISKTQKHWGLQNCDNFYWKLLYGQK